MSGPVLRGVLRRLARSGHAAALVLRGGLLTQLWAGAGRRATRDIDFLALFAADMGRGLRLLQEVLGLDVGDGVAYERDTLRGEVIWQETAFPGHRFRLDVRHGDEIHPLQIDLGFDDPLVPPAEWVDYPCLGDTARVLAARPELMAAWKLHGLFEHTARRWQAKDIYDLYLLTTCCALDHEALAAAIPVAFHSRGTSLGEVPGVLYDPAWWQADKARARWAKFRAAQAVAVPDDLAATAAAVSEALRPALAGLVALPTRG